MNANKCFCYFEIDSNFKTAHPLPVARFILYYARIFICSKVKIYSMQYIIRIAFTLPIIKYGFRCTIFRLYEIQLTDSHPFASKCRHLCMRQKLIRPFAWLLAFLLNFVLHRCKLDFCLSYWNDRDIVLNYTDNGKAFSWQPHLTHACWENICVLLCAQLIRCRLI